MKTVGAILASHRKKMRMSQDLLRKKLAGEGIRVTRSSISAWETGASSPSMDTLMALCRILKVTDLYGEYYGANPEFSYSLLSDEGKRKADEYIGLLLGRSEFRKDGGPGMREKVVVLERVRLPYFDLPASAGSGDYLDSGRFEMADIDGPVPEGTDFLIRVHGDSMMPDYKNGQLVPVHRQKEPEDGMVGIFGLNGNAYIKKLLFENEKAYLVSLNRSYGKIGIGKNDDFRVFGKVLV